MKRICVLLLCLLLVVASSAFAQSRPVYVQTRLLAAFDGPLEQDFFGEAFSWVVTANNAEAFNGVFEPEPQLNFVRSYPEALFNRNNPPSENTRSMGIRASFNRQAFNSLEIIPQSQVEDEPGIMIPGKAQAVDFWVWGSNRNYYMDVVLRDFRGIDHSIRMGTIAFRGWKQLRAIVPSTIPQDSNDPLNQGLRLTKIVLWTVPNERVDDFFLYLDELQVTTDIYANRYDGDELADPDVVESLWN